MKDLGMQWSWASSLICEVALKTPRFASLHACATNYDKTSRVSIISLEWRHVVVYVFMFGVFATGCLSSVNNSSIDLLGNAWLFRLWLLVLCCVCEVCVESPFGLCPLPNHAWGFWVVVCCSFPPHWHHHHFAFYFCFLKKLAWCNLHQVCVRHPIHK